MPRMLVHVTLVVNRFAWGWHLTQPCPAGRGRSKRTSNDPGSRAIDATFPPLDHRRGGQGRLACMDGGSGASKRSMTRSEPVSICGVVGQWQVQFRMDGRMCHAV